MSYLKSPVVGAAVCLGFGVVAVVSLPITAAEARPNTRSMTCSQAQSLVKQQGKVVMDTGPGTFEMFFADARYCSPPVMRLQPVFAPTKDRKSCAVGFRCYEKNNHRD